MPLNRRKLFVYFALPLSVSGILLAMYFSGVRFFENVVAMPYFEAVAENSRREFGLLENLQHLVLLGISVIALRAIPKQSHILTRALFIGIALGAVFMFAEEIDYGLHYYEYLAGVPHDEIAEERNLHNVGDRTSRLKTISDIGMILVFGIAPLVLFKVRNPWVRYLLPDRYMIATLIAAFIVRTLSHALDDRGYGHGLQSNMSEFRELITYYMGLLYTWQLARSRPGIDATDGEAPADSD